MARFLALLFVTFWQTLGSRSSRGPARPSWPFGFEVMIRALRKDWDATSEWDFARVRADLDARPYPAAMVKKVATRDEELGGVRARWFVPAEVTPGAIVLYFHGGSYIYGSAWTTHADVIARLALASHLPVAAIDYRLAPEHPYPAQLEDALRVFRALRERGDAERIILAGDSAGGNLVVMLQLALRDEGTPQAAAAVLISPWSDLTMPGRSYVDNDAFDFGTRDLLVRHAHAYAGVVPLDDPRLSPVNANLRGLAPVFITAGEAEIPRDDILAFADCLERAGVEVTRHLAPDMPHNAPMFAAYHPNGQAALAAIAAFIRGVAIGPENVEQRIENWN